MVEAAFNNDIPFPIDADFSDGEQAITAAADMDTCPSGAIYFAKWMDFAGGSYQITGHAHDSGRWQVGTDPAMGRVLFGNTSEIGTQEATIYIPPGRWRVDVAMQNILQGGDPYRCFFAFNLKQNGQLVYASDAEGWVFDVAPIVDADIPVPDDDPRLALPVFEVLPNWGSPVIERLSWETEIFTSETDVEQRRSLRRFARRSFEASFLRVKQERTRIDFFRSGVGKAKCLVPIWHEQIILAAAFDPDTPDLTLATGEAVLREFREDDLVIFMGKRPGLFTIARVALVDGDTLTFEFFEPTPPVWPAGSRLIPLRVARVMDEVTQENLTDEVGQTSLRFELADPETQFVGTDDGGALFPFNPEWSSPVSASFDRLDFVNDEDYGVVEVTDLVERTRVSSKFSLRFYDRASLVEFRNYLGMKRGRARRFRLPTFTNDIHPVDSVIEGASIDAHSSGFSRYFTRPQQARVFFIVFMRNGDTYEAEITACSESSPNIETFVLGDALPELQMADVLRISFVMSARFNQDAFELNHIVDDCKAVEISVITKTVEPFDWMFVWPDDGDGGGPPGPPPIDPPPGP